MEVCVNFFEWKSSCLIDELVEEISDKILKKNSFTFTTFGKLN